MKLLRVIHTLNPESGGPAQGIRNVTPSLTRMGVKTEIVCSDPDDAPYLDRSLCTINALGPANGRWGYNKALQPWLIANLHSFDAVICHGLWQYHGYVLRLAINKLKQSKIWKDRRIFVMPHGMLDPYFQEAPSRWFKALRNQIYWHLIEKKLINSSNGLLFTCQKELVQARRSFQDYHPKNELNIGYGIEDPPIFTEEMNKTFDAAFQSIRDRPFILFLGRIHEKKGVDLLINAYNRLSEAKASLPMLVVAGPGFDTRYGKRIVSMAAENEKIIVMSMLTGALKWAAMHRCACFILPSHHENFGISVVEAMSCGKAVLITEKVNIYIEICNAGAGIAAADTPAGVEELLSTWLGLDDAARLKMSNDARACYLEHFHIDSSSRKFLSVIQSVHE